jgi:hypothetical protein
VSNLEGQSLLHTRNRLGNLFVCTNRGSEVLYDPDGNRIAV